MIVRRSRFISEVDGASVTAGYRCPFGWRLEIVYDRDVYRLMPAWLYYLRRVANLRWHGYRTLVRLGFWSVREGELFTSGRWTWKFWWTLLLRKPCGAAITYESPYLPNPYRDTRWERFGWWIQRVIEQMQAPYA